MKVNRKELLEVLNKVKSGLSSSSNLNQSDNFIFHDGGIYSYNDKICAYHPFKTDFEGAIISDVLLGFISLCKEEELELIPGEKHLQIKSGKTSSKFVVSSIGDIMEYIKELDFSSGDDWGEVPKGFIEGLKYVIFSCSRDQVNILNGIQVKGSHLVSSDNLRISRWTFEGDLPGFIIPQGSAMALVNGEFSEYKLNKGWVFFRNQENVAFCSRLLSGKYPDVDKYFDFTAESVDLPEDFKSVLKLSNLFAVGEVDLDKIVEVEVKEGKIFVKASRDEGEILYEGEIASKEDFRFLVNPMFIHSILDNTNSFCFHNNIIRFQFDNFDHLISVRK